MNIDVDLVTVVVGLPDGEPSVLVVPGAASGADAGSCHAGAPGVTGDTRPALPAGPLEHTERSLQAGTRRWVEQLTGHHLGYLEQLYTFADADRSPGASRSISISYLGLTRATTPGERWVGCYDLLPWEDRRTSTALIDDVLAPKLAAWAANAESPEEARARGRRVAMTFGLDGSEWVPDLVLQRYELLYEAGLLPETPDAWRQPETAPGEQMRGDHRRILATALGRLRAKIQYRPVVFELLPPEFTLAELQRCVEAIAGHGLHTQNFRRLVNSQRLVEPSGEMTSTGGRPAQLFRFHEDVVDARAVAGTKLPTMRGGR